MPLLSVIVPVYNEANTIREILRKIESVEIDKEVIVVDDGSSDATGKTLREIPQVNLKVIHHTSNRGKGAAVLTGLSHAIGDFVIIQDADLEYEPSEYYKLLDAMRKQGADIVLGARFTKGYQGSFIPRFGNRFLTTFLNLLFHTGLNDCFTCYKLFRRSTILALGLKSQSFDIEIEIVAKAVKAKLRLLEVPIAYRPRTYAQGKKIRWGDGLQAIGAIIKYRLSE